MTATRTQKSYARIWQRRKNKPEANSGTRPSRAKAYRRGIDLAYLLSENDQVLARPGAEFADRLGLKPTMLPGGHDAMLSHPDDIAEAILRA